MIFDSFISKIRLLWKKYAVFAGGQAVQTLEWETAEMEHIFTLITLGAFIGMPAPPMQITFELLPEMENELTFLINKVDTSNAPLSELFSALDIT
jgi:hypothetical protein